MKAETDLAFPSSKVVLGKTFNHDGMDLRDYFAAKAIQGLLANPDHVWGETTYAKFAYTLADKMLEARE